jgi:hypothetical protein
MATRGSALDRAIRYFEEASLREVRVAFQIVKEVVETRLAGAQTAQEKPKRVRAARKVNGDAAVIAGAKEHESLSQS